MVVCVYDNGHVQLYDENLGLWIVVTGAILRAERLPHGEEKRDAYREVCLLEQAIADITSPRSIEGEASRWGAVRAAGRSGDSALAIQLADVYLAHNIAPEIRVRIERLKAEAERLTLPCPT
jgi:hypothetical protein